MARHPAGRLWNGDNPSYYERSAWGSFYDHPDVVEKTRVILEMIPDGVRSVLDVGCGDGAITNVLAERYDTTGVDRSTTALRHVTTRAVRASAESLPFEDLSFDLVLASELLEHLPHAAFRAATSEMIRVSRGWLLVAVPNAEDLAASGGTAPSAILGFMSTITCGRSVPAVSQLRFPGGACAR